MCLCAVKGKGNPYIGRLVPCVHLKSGMAQDGKSEGPQIHPSVENTAYHF